VGWIKLPCGSRTLSNSIHSMRARRGSTPGAANPRRAIKRLLYLDQFGMQAFPHGVPHQQKSPIHRLWGGMREAEWAERLQSATTLRCSEDWFCNGGQPHPRYESTSATEGIRQDS
jgi:hypothetical protein